MSSLGVRVRVLVVDNEALNVESYCALLHAKRPDWDVVGATSTDEALETFSTYMRAGNRFDVVVADLIMETPESGYALLERMLLQSPSLVAIMVSATSEDFNRQRAVDSRIFDVISKNQLKESFPAHLLYRIDTGVNLQRSVQDSERLRRFLDSRLEDFSADSPELMTIGARRVAIAFWDIAGFSRLVDNLRSHPEVVGQFLDDFFSSAREVINRNDGVVDKFIGDGVMAIFGLCGRSEDVYCYSAVKAAKELRDSFQSTLASHRDNLMRYSARQVDAGLRCGVHLDDALVGVFSAGTRSHFTAIGSGVNLASRLEALAATNQIVVSQSVRASIGDRIDWPEPSICSGIKNIDGDFPVFRL